MRSLTSLVILTLLFAVFTGCKADRKYTAAVVGCRFANADNSGKAPVNTTADTISAKAYAITFTQLGIITGHDNGADIKEENQYNVTNEVLRLSVTAVNDFDSIHPAGTNLKDIFYQLTDTIKYNLLPLGDGRGYPTFNFRVRKSDLDTMLYTQWLVLMQPPRAPGSYSFAINVDLADSTRYNDTIHIYLK